MTRSEFEEKEFESAANIELATPSQCPLRQGMGNRIELWAPGQVLESVLGFDVLVTIPHNRTHIERLLKVVIPPGFDWRSYFRSVADFEQFESAPTGVASLFLQYKRSDYVKRSRPIKGEATSSSDTLRPPFFRFAVDPRQDRTLRDFARAARHLALVYYAAPRFHRREELRDYRRAGAVLDNTEFIRPLTNAHRTVNFDGKGKVFGCSNPESGTGVSFRQIINELTETGNRQDGSLLRHVLALRTALSIERHDENPVAELLQFAAVNDLVWLLVRVNRAVPT